jgi:hypothetical protein
MEFEICFTRIFDVNPMKLVESMMEANRLSHSSNTVDQFSDPFEYFKIVTGKPMAMKDQPESMSILTTMVLITDENKRIESMAFHSPRIIDQ